MKPTLVLAKGVYKTSFFCNCSLLSPANNRLKVCVPCTHNHELVSLNSCVINVFFGCNHCKRISSNDCNPPKYSLFAIKESYEEVRGILWVCHYCETKDRTYSSRQVLCTYISWTKFYGEIWSMFWSKFMQICFILPLHVNISSNSWSFLFSVSFWSY